MLAHAMSWTGATVSPLSFCRSESGSTALEYVLIVAMLTATVLVAMSTLGALATDFGGQLSSGMGLIPQM